MLALLLPIGVQILGWFVNRSIDSSKESKVMWEKYQEFIKAVDAHRSVKIHQSAKDQRDKLKDL